MNGIKLRGTGRCVPANVITNDDLAKLVDTNDAWITARTGIRADTAAPQRPIRTSAQAPPRPLWKRPGSPRRRSGPASWPPFQRTP